MDLALVCGRPSDYDNFGKLLSVYWLVPSENLEKVREQLLVLRGFCWDKVKLNISGLRCYWVISLNAFLPFIDQKILVCQSSLITEAWKEKYGSFSQETLLALAGGRKRFPDHDFIYLRPIQKREKKGLLPLTQEEICREERRQRRLFQLCLGKLSWLFGIFPKGNIKNWVMRDESFIVCRKKPEASGETNSFVSICRC